MQPTRSALDQRRRDLERVLLEMGLENLDGIEEWDGQDLQFLRQRLGPEQYEDLLDRLESESEESD